MKQLLKATLFLLLTLSTGNLYAKLSGQLYADSLLSELPLQKEDTNKVNLLNDLANTYHFFNPDEGIVYSRLALELAVKLNWKKGIASANTLSGASYMGKSNHTMALDILYNALKLHEEIDNKIGISRTTNFIGIVYFRQQNYPKALEYFFKAMKINEEIGNTLGVLSTTGNVGNVHSVLGDYHGALEYYLKALKVAEESGNKEAVVMWGGNIGYMYKLQENYTKALEYHLKQLKVAEEIDNKGFMAMAGQGVGGVYKALKNYPMALKYYFQALKVGEEGKSKNHTPGIAASIGEVYVAQYNYAEGIPWLFKALKMDWEYQKKEAQAEHLLVLSRSCLAMLSDVRNGKMNDNIKPYKADSLIPHGKAALLNRITVFLDTAIAINRELKNFEGLRDCYASLSIADSLLGDYKAALFARAQYIVFMDSFLSQKNTMEVGRIEMQRQIQSDSLKSLQAKNIAELRYRQQRNYTYAGLAGVLALIAFSVFIIRERRKSEKERKKSDGLLLNILPSEVADELKTKGTTRAKHFDNVTVLFTDFVNFTNAGERMSPQNLVDELHTCFKAFDEITEKYNIEKIKTVGDAYLAVAGLPAADPRHAENIVRAAIEITAFIEDRLSKMGNECTFAIRIGIHSGSVVAGIVGVKKFAYDIWGDTVNTAARMEQNSEAGKINISQTTYELVKDKISCEYRGEIDAKGKGVMKMYFVNS